nr:PREDICTED: low-density lipoprotein receptor class A domain-containing protein 1 isoform X1 [Anolis carolinensis]|eukprot:XP_008107618.1 PREDICTED: low-density lipoprotein receptor class A domain-containing protein 1 isoform X1 [Anolis carolinensis]
MTRTYPQNFDGSFLGSEKSLSVTKRGTIRDQQDCCKFCTRRCICVSAIGFIILAIIIAAIAIIVTVGIPPRTAVNRLCVTTSNQTGFLCDNRETCITASQVCDTRRHCANGEDEQKTLCSDLPNNLPGYLIFHCGNPRYWIPADKRCNGINDCGDCSDEVGTCKSVHFKGPAALLVGLSGGAAPWLSFISIVPAFPEAFVEMAYSTALTGLMNISAQSEQPRTANLHTIMGANHQVLSLWNHHSF